ncbi:hypothetical protein DL768_008776 [Monosporascus sp. mg162]|nr:hypothetical protein DL768_008776 [Monosporascus sp. mg162]
MFLTAVEDKAGSWCKTMHSTTEPQKEKNSKGKKGKRGRNGGRSQGNNNQSNSSRNTRGNTRGGGPGEEQFIPEGLGDLYRSSGGTFSAHIDEQQLQGADSPEATATVANCPEQQAANCPEATAIEDDRPVATVADCPGVTATAPESPEATVANCPELQVANCTELQAADCPETIATAIESPEATVVGSAMLLHVHSSMENNEDKLFWDLEANVNITNNIKDFEKNSVLDIKNKGIYIMIGGKPIIAIAGRTVK